MTRWISWRVISIDYCILNKDFQNGSLAIDAWNNIGRWASEIVHGMDEALLWRFFDWRNKQKSIVDVICNIIHKGFSLYVELDIFGKRKMQQMNPSCVDGAKIFIVDASFGFSVQNIIPQHVVGSCTKCGSIWFNFEYYAAESRKT